jgi:hypothetical protein
LGTAQKGFCYNISLMKNILIAVVLLVLLAGGVYWAKSRDRVAKDENWTTDEIVIDATDGKLKAAVFQGKLEEAHPGCFADGECYVVVDGKHVTVVMGWSQETVGSLVGVPSFGDLESHIGENFEVYAQNKSDGTYTLYGSEGFYVKLLGGNQDL